MSGVGDERVTHVVVEEGLEEVREERRKRVREGKRLFHLVNSSWLDASVREGRLVNETDFSA